MLVLHISGAKTWGGNEQQLVDILPALEKLKIQNLVFGVKNSSIHKKCIEENIEFISSEERKLNCFANYFFLKKILRTYNPDIIHLHTSNAVTVFTISDLLCRLKVPAVFSKKGMGRSMSWLSIYKYNYKNIKVTLCVSEAVRKTMISNVTKPRNLNRLKVIYEGININRILKVENKNTSYTKSNDSTKKAILGNIANHVRAKDLTTLVKAISFLVNDLDYTNFHLYQIGSFSNLTEELKSLIKDLGVSNHISLLGFIEDASSRLSTFDIYVMSSQREGLPLTIYEAFYKKTPIVSTKAGGIPEIITDGHNGFLVEVGDYKQMAMQIKKLIDSTILQEQFTQNSYNLFINNFTTEKTAIKISEVYNELK